MPDTQENAAPKNPETSSRDLLRHALATLAYRGGKALRGAPAEFAALRADSTVRTPGEILAHIGDVLDWGLSLARGKQQWRVSDPLPWEEGVARFFASLEALDGYLASQANLGCPAEQLFQGPVADALTHIGQISMLRRMAGFPVRAENYLQATIKTGRVGVEQTPPKREFD
jgi:hypothetical protein